MGARIEWNGERVVLIPVSQGAFTIVDEADAERVMAAGKWQSGLRGKKLYVTRQFRLERGLAKQIYLHTFLTGYAITDHINGQTLDNRRANLREATAAENARNDSTPSRSASGFRGVHLHRVTGLWHAQITLNGRAHSLRYHKTPRDAALAYDAAARILHGEFATLNFPDEAPESVASFVAQHIQRSAA